MTKYLVSIPSPAMVIPPGEFQTVADRGLGAEAGGGVPLRSGAAGVHVRPDVVRALSYR